MSTYRWTNVGTAALPRSSHSISLIDNKAYIFGGEINPREPVDNALHVVDVTSGSYAPIEGKGDVPEARVGHVSGVIDGSIYIFGGRGGPAMSPLDESGAVYSFSPATSTWSKLLPSTDIFPCARSYHTATATPTHLVVHAGCGDASTGRLRDTWFFDVSTKSWTKGPEGPGDTRGGTAITYHDGKIWRFGGFNGKTELGGSVDYLTLSQSLTESKWETIEFGDTAGLSREDTTDLTAGGTIPGPRSVHALLTLGGRIVTFFGEGKPSPTGGHDAAGNFWGDIWAFDPAQSTWEEIKIEGETPKERGWFAADQADGKVIIWGGLDAANERLTDGWLLSA